MDFVKESLKQINLENDTLFDIIYELLFFKALEESNQDIKNNRVITLDELKKELEAKYESYNNPKSQK